jgi:hypothetical protein
MGATGRPLSRAPSPTSEGGIVAHGNEPGLTYYRPGKRPEEQPKQPPGALARHRPEGRNPLRHPGWPIKTSAQPGLSHLGQIPTPPAFRSLLRSRCLHSMPSR